jgi:hypothetical protein
MSLMRLASDLRGLNSEDSSIWLEIILAFKQSLLEVSLLSRYYSILLVSR